MRNEPQHDHLAAPTKSPIEHRTEFWFGVGHGQVAVRRLSLRGPHQPPITAHKN